MGLLSDLLLCIYTYCVVGCLGMSVDTCIGFHGFVGSSEGESGQHSAKMTPERGEVLSNRADSVSNENSMRHYNIYTQVIQKC